MSGATDDLLLGFGLANYRSFGQEGFVLEEPRKVNVLIGKNNSGKSNALRAIRVLAGIARGRPLKVGAPASQQGVIGMDGVIDAHGRSNVPPHAIVWLRLPDVPGPMHEVAKTLKGRLEVRWNTETRAPEQAPSLDSLSIWHVNHVAQAMGLGPVHSSSRDHVAALSRELVTKAIAALAPLGEAAFVEAFRQIRQGPEKPATHGTFNGDNIIKALRRMQHPKMGQETQREQFDSITRFVRDLLGERLLTIEIRADEDIIYVNMQARRLPLESYGAGVHQLVLLCAALVIHDGCTICLEEPENHLHPELQRRFLRFILDQTKNRYFITTHSNVLLDFRPDVAIYHVSHDGEKSTVTRVKAGDSAREVLADLGCRASDLLQANCVIWVEGPSDRIYLNKWLRLAAPDWVEGIHYAIAFYGGKTLAHFGCTDEPLEDLVEVLRINQHAIFVMDRDEPKGGKLNATKERVRAELGEERCWVTKGREIENYLRPATIQRYIKEQFKADVTLQFGEDDRVEDAIARATKGTAADAMHYDRRKPHCAREMCSLMTADDLDVLDLHDRLNTIVGLIHRWNGLSSPSAT